MSSSQTVDDAINSRMSCRAFTDLAVPRETILEILALASRAPSGTNTQPWKVYVLQGKERDALIAEVCAAHDALYGDPALAAQFIDDYDYYPTQWVSPFIERRRENGWGLYKLLGIERGEKDKMHAQHQRNYHYFDAPIGLVFTMSRKMGRGSILDYGMFLQNVMLAARARGLDTCPQGAWNGFSSIVKRHVGASADELMVTCMALGYADPSEKINSYRTPREPVESFTHWVE
ncbi:MAG: nitroreductase [Burkholderiaceae bacterium]